MICFVVWLASGGGYLWPLWIAGPWGAIMIGRWISGSHPGGGPHPGGPHHHGPHQGRQIRAERPDQIGGGTRD
jgi:hypothetical protein